MQHLVVNGELSVVNDQRFPQHLGALKSTNWVVGGQT